MYLFLLILLTAFIITCFSLYTLIREDVIFIRKNISTDQIFNSTFIGLFAGLLGARLLFVLFHLKSSYLNPFVFLLFPYYPGLSLFGGVIGFLLFEYLYTQPKKIPSFRLSDFYAISILWGVAIGSLLMFIQNLLLQKHIGIPQVIIVFLYFVFSFLFSNVLLPILRRGELQEGSIAILFLASFGFLMFFAELLSQTKSLIFVFDLEGLVSVVIFLVSLVIFLQREKIALRIKK